MAEERRETASGEVVDSAEVFFGTPKRIVKGGRGIVFDTGEGREVVVYGFGERGFPPVPPEVRQAVEEGRGHEYALTFSAVRHGEYYRLRSVESDWTRVGSEAPRREAEDAPTSSSAEGTEPPHVEILITRAPDFDGLVVKGPDDREIARLAPGTNYERVPLELPPEMAHAEKVVVHVRIKTADGQVVGWTHFTAEVRDGRVFLNLALTEDGRLRVSALGDEKVKEVSIRLSRASGSAPEAQDNAREGVDKEYRVEPSTSGAPESEPRPESEPSRTEASRAAASRTQTGEVGEETGRSADRSEGAHSGHRLQSIPSELAPLAELIRSIAKEVVAEVFERYERYHRGFDYARLRLQYLDLALKAASDLTEKQFRVLQLAGVRLLDPQVSPEKRVRKLMESHNLAFKRNLRSMLSIAQKVATGHEVDMRGLGLGRSREELQVLSELLNMGGPSDSASPEESPEV